MADSLRVGTGTMCLVALQLTHRNPSRMLIELSSLVKNKILKPLSWPPLPPQSLPLPPLPSFHLAKEHITRNHSSSNSRKSPVWAEEFAFRTGTFQTNKQKNFFF